MAKLTLPPGKRVIWRPWITVKGRRIYAAKYGKSAFPILVNK